MTRTILLYAAALALGAVLLNWLEYQYLARVFTTELYIGLIALGFIGLGVWLGRRLTPQPAPRTFERNTAAVAALGLTARECEILDLLATGKSMKELARDLGVSPNTVKTHVVRVYQKLEVQRRVHAIEKARSLSLIA